MRALWLTVVVVIGCSVDSTAIPLDAWDADGHVAVDSGTMELIDGSRRSPEASIASSVDASIGYDAAADADALSDGGVDSGDAGAAVDSVAPDTGIMTGMDAGHDSGGCIPGPLYPDSDGDSWGAGDPVLACGHLAGHTPLLGDCYDHNASAKPGAIGWFTDHRGDGSFDYNCDGIETPQWTAVQRCPNDDGPGTPGWIGEPPACGKSGTWKTSSFCPGGIVAVIQPCR